MPSNQTLNEENEEVVEEEVTEEEETEEESSEEEEGSEEEEAEEEEEKPAHESSVPYERFKDKTDENAVLRKALDLVNRGNRAPEKDEALPEIDADVAKVLQSVVGKATRNVQQVIGNILEQLDEVKSLNVIPNYKDHASKIQSLREEKANQGVYMTREDAYSFLVGKGQIVNQEKLAKKSSKKVIKETSPTKGAVKKETTKGAGPSKEAPTAKKFTLQNADENTLKELEKRLAGKSF